MSWWRVKKTPEPLAQYGGTLALAPQVAGQPVSRKRYSSGDEMLPAQKLLTADIMLQRIISRDIPGVGPPPLLALHAVVPEGL
jgi:hypothetical protein